MNSTPECDLEAKPDAGSVDAVAEAALVPSDAVIVGPNEAAPGAGARILALAKEHNVIRADELPEVLASIERARNGE